MNINLRNLLKLGGFILLCTFGNVLIERAQAWNTLPALFGSDTGCLLGNDSSTVLLIHSNTIDGDTTFVDSGKGPNSPHTISSDSDPNHVTVQYMYGTSSMYFDGDDRLYSADSVDWDFGTGDYIVDFWVRWPNPVANGGLVGRYVNEANTWGLQYSGGDLLWYYGAGANYTFAWIPAATTWYYIEVTRVSGNIYVWVDGVQRGVTQANATNHNTASQLAVGDYSKDAAGQKLTGWMDEVRIVKGVGGHTSAYNIPGGPYCD